LLGGNTRLHGRLSVYYSSEPTGGDGNDEEFEEDSDEDRDDESVMSGTDMSDNMFPLDDMDADDEEDYDAQFGGQGGAYGYGEVATPGKPSEVSWKRIKAGPPQNNDTKSRKIPPQVTLKRIENMMHKFTRHISVELVHAPVYTNATISEDVAALDPNGVVAKAVSRRQVHDEFDRLLGLETKSANPVVRIASTYLGPVLRMVRIVVYVFRVAFNIATWRDPFLSFWIFSFFFAIFLILLVFPWRAFFFLSTLVCLGPQVILIVAFAIMAVQRLRMLCGSISLTLYVVCFIVCTEYPCPSVSDKESSSKRGRGPRWRWR
jgi:hypothetical protein